MCPPPVPPDLTAEERLELESIRRRKQELLGEIQRLREELSEAMSEVEGLEANEGRYPPNRPPPAPPNPALAPQNSPLRLSDTPWQPKIAPAGPK